MREEESDKRKKRGIDGRREGGRREGRKESLLGSRTMIVSVCVLLLRISKKNS